MDIDISGDILRHILGKWHTLWFATYYQDISIPNSGELGLHLNIVYIVHYMFNVCLINIKQQYVARL